MSTASYFDVIDGTWPAARHVREGPWTLREGQGGGSRVSAATAEALVTDGDVTQAEAGMRALGQPPLFMLRPGDETLDTMLDARGYTIADPVTIYACSVETLCDVPLPRVTVLLVWKPLAIMAEIWAEGGIGPARLAVMARAKGPKIAMLGRNKDKPAGVAFAAIHDGVAMVHAVEVIAFQRRAGMGQWFMRAAAIWAKDNGAHTISVMCTDQNVGANALYTSLAMPVVGHYHYRKHPTE